MEAENIRVPIPKDEEESDDEQMSVVEGEEETKEPEDDDVVVDDNDDDDDDDEEEEEEDGEEEDEEDDGGDGQARKAIKEQKKIIRKKKQQVPIGEIAAEEDDDDEQELMDEDYIQRVHPEAILPDSRELRATLANKDIKRRSRPILSKYEATTIVGMRAQQIAKGSAPFIDTDESDPVDIAMKELRAKLIPVIVRRIMPDNISEYWRLSELTYYE